MVTKEKAKDNENILLIYYQSSSWYGLTCECKVQLFYNMVGIRDSQSSWLHKSIIIFKKDVLDFEKLFD